MPTNSQLAAERDFAVKALADERIRQAFASSAYVRYRLMLPAEMAQKTFGEHFRMDGVDVVAVDKSGRDILSKTRLGSPASFDEALDVLVGETHYRNSILRAHQSRGSGAVGSSSGHGKSTMSRAAFDQLTTLEQRNAVMSGVTVDQRLLTRDRMSRYLLIRFILLIAAAYRTKKCVQFGLPHLGSG